MKMHHVVTDGLGFAILFATLQDHYVPQTFIQTKGVLSGLKKTAIFLMGPLLAMNAVWRFLTWNTDRNLIRGDKKLTGVKQNAITKCISVTRLKQIGKAHNNASINDVVLGLTSVALHDYLRRR